MQRIDSASRFVVILGILRGEVVGATEVFRSYCGEYTGGGKILQLSNLTVYRVPCGARGRFQGSVCLDAVLVHARLRFFF
jgi:hypothetical protein